MKAYKLFAGTTIGLLSLKNHVVMAPLTRCRAIGNIPNTLMAKYYEQRSKAGLIITEGTSPSSNGMGYARIPGIFTGQQIEGWKKVTAAVHENGGKIFVQLMHCGRISHPMNMSEGTEVLAPSAVKAAGQMWTDANQLQDFPVPKAMTAEDIKKTLADFVTAAKNAISAGFDGVELHAANGYLLEEFISPLTNIRTDIYGGSIANRCRFIIEIAIAVTEAIGKEKTAIRLSPYGVANDMAQYNEIDATYDYLSKQLNNIGLLYIHLADHSAMGAPVVPVEIKKLIRNNFKNTIILCGNYNKESAEADIESGLADLVAFGRPFINNPDFVERMKNNWPMSEELQTELFYTAGETGYTDYPAHEDNLVMKAAFIRS
ncbi:MAG: alkene reductase [Rhizobacter sp.]|nr:alkene reductase [Ferruginibacter sp.]